RSRHGPGRGTRRSAVKQKASPVVAVVIVLAVIGIVAAVVWGMSEAPIVGVLPKGSAMGGPPGPVHAPGTSGRSGTGSARSGMEASDQPGAQKVETGKPSPE